MPRKLVPLLFWAFTCLSWTATAGPYSGYTVSTLIPFVDQTYPKTWQDLVHVQMRVGSTSGVLLNPWIDTGSTGVILPGSSIAGFNYEQSCTTRNLGFHYLTSSNILYLGCWINKDLYFNTEKLSDGTRLPVVHSRVPILAVYKKIECDEDTDDLDVFSHRNCVGRETPDPTGFGFIGIGWGRMDDGQPDGTSNKNPMINVVEIQGVTDIRKLYKGFIIKKNGINVGLTEGNTVGIDFDDLPVRKNDGSSGGGSGGVTPNWGLIPACIWFDRESPGTDPCQEVSALLDTGIDQSYFRIPSTTSGHLPPRVDPPTDIRVVTNTPVTVSFKPSVSGWRFGSYPSEAFKVGMFTGDDRDVTPSEMRAYGKSGYVVRNFFNSGRRIFRKYEISHDAVLGRVGFKRWS